MPLGDVDGDDRDVVSSVREWLPVVLADIVREHQPLKIILFGSVARGEERPDSDIDLLVVLDHVPFDNKIERMIAIHRTVGGRIPADIHVTDPPEIARRGHLTGSILHPALREGVVIYERAA